MEEEVSPLPSERGEDDAMSVNVDQLADELVRLLNAGGQPADRFTTGPGTAGINVWGEEGRYPLTSVTISDSGTFHDYAWGPNYENTLPIDAPPATVAEAVLKTLNENTAVGEAPAGS